MGPSLWCPLEEWIVRLHEDIQHYQQISLSMFFTTCDSYFITLGAVSPRPYFSQAALVASRTILEASAGPYSQSQSEVTDATPARMSPIPPHRFFPPSLRMMKDRSLPMTISCVPLTSSLKCGKAQLVGNSVISSLELYLVNISSMSILYTRCRMASYRQLGVRMVLKRESSSKRCGQWQRQQMPSASKITMESLGRFFISRGRNSCMYRSLPSPGPMIQLLMAFSHPFNLLAHSSVISSLYFCEYFTSSSDTNTGCTMISGEQDLIAGELNLEQKICERSPPTFSAEMAEQKGAPVNQKLPPTTAILPLSPFLVRLLRSGKASFIRLSNCCVARDIASEQRNYLNYYQKAQLTWRKPTTNAPTTPNSSTKTST